MTHTVYGAFVDGRLVYVGRTMQGTHRRASQHLQRGTGPYKLHPPSAVEWRVLRDGVPDEDTAHVLELAAIKALQPPCNGTVERPGWLTMLWRRLRALGRRVVRWVVRSLAVVGAVTVAWLVAS